MTTTKVISAADRKCACGHGRHHPEVQQEPEYTLWGWIMLSMLGMTPTPDRIVYRCIRCRQTLGSTRDPKLLHKKRMPDADARTDATSKDESAR